MLYNRDPLFDYFRGEARTPQAAKAAFSKFKAGVDYSNGVFIEVRLCDN